MTTQTGPTRQGPTERCTCGHTKRDHSGRRDHHDKYGPTVAGRPWCHACETECIYCPPDSNGERGATSGYCPACGRGDVAPTAEEYEQQRQRAAQAEAAIVRTHHVADLIEAGAPWTANHQDTARRLREALTTDPAATEATGPRVHCGDLTPETGLSTVRTE